MLRDKDIERLSPLLHEHINLHGRYYCGLTEALQRGELRALSLETREMQCRNSNCPPERRENTRELARLPPIAQGKLTEVFAWACFFTFVKVVVAGLVICHLAEGWRMMLAITRKCGFLNRGRVLDLWIWSLGVNPSRRQPFFFAGNESTPWEEESRAAPQ